KWLDTIYIAVILLQGTYTPLVYAHDGRTQSLNRQLLLAQQLIPGIHSIGFLTTQDNIADVQKQLKHSRIDASFEIQIVKDQKSLGRALSHIIQTSELLITLAEPEIYNRASLKNILLSSYRNNIPLLGLNKAFVDAGCLAAVYTTTEQFAQETADIINKALVNGQIPRINYAKYYEVSLNHKVARSLGLYLFHPKLSRQFFQKSYFFY
ncbi:MAG: hypothetical protein KZQ56_12215, partial [gamma proteobacterium symbiont of Lucinoma myriamae]|nr:hypothetical protein [gamma proteobacterium symbiont of Lucinoma myriamae]